MFTGLHIFHVKYNFILVYLYCEMAREKLRIAQELLLMYVEVGTNLSVPKGRINCGGDFHALRSQWQLLLYFVSDLDTNKSYEWSKYSSSEFLNISFII